MPWMLLNILQQTEQPSTRRNYHTPNVIVERLRNPGLCLRSDSGSLLCINPDILILIAIVAMLENVYGYAPCSFWNTLGKLPFGDPVLTNICHLQRTHQFPHFEFLGWWTSWSSGGVQRPDTKKHRVRLIFFLGISLEIKQIWIVTLLLFFFLLFKTAPGETQHKIILGNR